MISASDEVAALVRSGGYRLEYVADVIVDGERVLEAYPLTSADLSCDGDAKVRATGRAVVQYSDDQGGSILPSDITSWLTPYATVLEISHRFTAGEFQESVLLGTFKIIRVTDPQDSRKPFQGTYISLGSSVGLQLADLFRVTDRERFPAPFGPSDLSSVFAEIGRLTLLPLLRNVDDVPISRAVTYKDNRLDAVFDLATMLGGVPYVNAFGQVTIEPDVWPAESEEFATGSEGVIVSVLPSDLTDESIYNQVVVRSWDDGQAAILATREVASGKLRYGGVFGRVPYFASSQYVTTVAQAEAYAEELLPQVSSVPAVQLELQVLPDPRREVGDVVPFEWDGYSWLARIREIRRGSGLMSVRVLAERGAPVTPDEDLFYPAEDLFPDYDLYPFGGSL